MPGKPTNPKTLKQWLEARTIHGAYVGGKECPEHYVWRSMIARCNNPKAKHYEYYGALGVTVCSQWLEYQNFIADMGCRPTIAHQLDRIDPNGNYSPNNCRWVTRNIQQKNKRSTKRWLFDGQIGTLSECAVRLGISIQLAHYRLRHWGTFEKGKRCLLQKAA